MSHSPTNAAESPDDSQLDDTLQPSASTTVERISLESLPDELLVEIIRNCGNVHAPSVARKLCLVSKRMQPVATRELYHRITLVAFATLRILCRTLEEKPQLGQYIVNLKLLVSSYGLQPSEALQMAPEAAFQLLWSLYYEVLKRSTGLRQVTMMVATDGGNILPTQSAYYRFIARLSEAITRSQNSGSTTAILPRLDQVRLTTDTHSQPRWHLPMVQSEVFKPFLHLPSMLTLEGINDSGAWDYCDSPVLPRVTSTSVANVHQYGQLKSVLLRESDCNPTDIMDLINMFPAMEVLFVQTRPTTSLYSRHKAKQAIIKQTNADQSAKRYLSSSFEKLQKLSKLAYIPHSNDSRLRGGTGDFLGPARLLNLKNLRNLTSLSVLISAFTSPNGPNTRRLTVSPMEVLPRSLRSLHIIAGDHTSKAVLGDTPAYRSWFQPRAAALGFMQDLAEFRPTEFPRLQHVEYIWAVNRLAVGHRCDGSYLECCDMHSNMQALSPDMDYTSKYEGIVSPFKIRFDNLELALSSVGVTFKAVELKKYSDFFDHWQQGRK